MDRRKSNKMKSDKNKAIMAKKRNGAGRPRINIDVNILSSLAQIGCTQEEMASVEILREALAKDLATYGNNEVKSAISNGAAESMLILSEKTRSKEGRMLLKLANQNRTEVIEISSHHHGGEMLSGLGDIAVVLRYKLT